MAHILILRSGTAPVTKEARGRFFRAHRLPARLTGPRGKIPGMDEEFPDVRRSIRFWAWIILAAAAVFAVWFEGVVLMRPQTKTLTTYSPIPPNEIKQLAAYVSGPPRAVGLITNIQVPAARRLEAVGPSAKQYGRGPGIDGARGHDERPRGQASGRSGAEKASRSDSRRR